MSDTLPENPGDPDAVPLNERSRAFIDGAAFLNFVRLKSRAVPQQGSLKKSSATGADGGDTLKARLADQDEADASTLITPAMEVEIQDEDWDSLFGAVEERLRDTVDALDLMTPQLAAQDKLSRIKSMVLDCVSSLDALHKALRHDRGLQSTSSPDRTIAGVRSASRPTSANGASRKN